MKMLLLGLLFAISCGLKAQDKYEYAILRYYALREPSIVLTEADKKTDIPSDKKNADIKTIEKVNELSKQGWEVYSSSDYIVNSTPIVVTYFLRRKNKE